MKKIFLFLSFSIVALYSCQSGKEKTDVKTQKTTTVQKTPTNLYDFKVEGLTGNTINFADFKGKKVLVVNTASECGYTGQYEDLQKLSEMHKENLVVVGFPANNFGGQEPGSNEEIASFCKKNYGVTFPMASKVSVKGDDTAPIFQFLTQKSLNGVKESEIKWNFTKFLLDENGKLIDSFPSKVKPMDDEIMKHLH